MLGQPFRSRTTHTSVLDRLTAAGHDPETITGEHSTSRAAVPAIFTAVDGTKIAGMVYTLDFRAEEEYGVGDLRKAITGTDPLSVSMMKGAQRHVAAFADAPAIVVATHFLPSQAPAWGDHLTDDTWHTPTGTPDYASYWSQALSWVRRDEFTYNAKAGRLSMVDLRAKAKVLGLTNLPRTKDALTDLIVNSAEYAAVLDLPDVWPGWFHNGKELVLRADDGAGRVVIEALQDAIRAGTLAIGTYSGAFASGMFLYDVRDETDAIRKDRKQQVQWYDARMRDLAPVERQLKEWGHKWFFLGKPSEHTTADGQTVVRYWLNGYGASVARDGTSCRRQPWGWYTLAELLDEKFVRDQAAKESERELAGR